MPALMSASGLLCFGPSMIATIAFILSLYANSRCRLVNIDEDSVLRDNFSLLFEPEKFGLWCYQATNGNNYDIQDVNLGSTIESARALGVTCNVFGLLIWIFYLVAGCKRFPPVIFRVTGFMCILTCLFQGLVFLVFKSDVICSGSDLGCTLSSGGKCGVSACVFWFLAGIFSCNVGKKAGDDEDADEEVKEPEEDVADEA